MDCICSRTCTVRLNGKSIFVEQGQILEFEKCPKEHFEILGEVKIDFNNVSLEHLLKSNEWKTADAINWLKKEFGFKPMGMETRREIARTVIDKRNRKITLPNEVG